MQILQNHRLNQLKKKHRFEKGIFYSPAYAINYIDALSFYHEYQDIFKNRIYHFETKVAQPNIIDAGGYIGLSTLYFKSIYPNSKIKIFEPDPNIITVLKENIKQNNLNDITVIEAGLGDSERTASFFPDQADGGSMYQTNAQQKIEVNITTLSKYINESVDLLKMNIEGAEGEVFQEISKKLPLVKEIIFEYHAFSDLPQSLGDILQLLDKNGFRYVITDATSAKIPVPFNMPKQHRFFNLVYAKNALI